MVTNLVASVPGGSPSVKKTLKSSTPVRSSISSDKSDPTKDGETGKSNKSLFLANTSGPQTDDSLADPLTMRLKQDQVTADERKLSKLMFDLTAEQTRICSEIRQKACSMKNFAALCMMNPRG